MRIELKKRRNKRSKIDSIVLNKNTNFFLNI